MMANIYCCECKRRVLAISVRGHVVYPDWRKYRSVAKKIFWQCPHCKNFVGSHENCKDKKPLGCIPTKKLKRLRQNLHAVLDPLYKSGKITRTQLYKRMAKELDIPEYHTANLRSEAEAKQAWLAAMKIRDELDE